MTKRVSDYNDLECNLAFAEFDIETKRQLIGSTVYASPTIYRDILRAHILPRLDAQTFARLRRSCKQFYNWFTLHPDVLQIRAFLADPTMGPPPRAQMERQFRAYARRLEGILRLRNDNLRDGFIDLVKFDVDRYRNRHVTYVAVGSGYIHWPTGLICKEREKPFGHIFEEDPTHAFQFESYGFYFKYHNAMTPAEKREAKRYREQFKLITF
jgi:hypothetical protein